MEVAIGILIIILVIGLMIVENIRIFNNNN